MVEDVCVRFAKFFYARDIIWSSIQSVAEKYEGFPELNYHLVEAFYLKFEVMLSFMIITKVFICHNNSKQWCTMIPNSIIGHAMNKLGALELIFDKYPTRYSKGTKEFCHKNRVFLQFARLLSLYLSNKVDESTVTGRKKTLNQIYHENFLLS